MFVILGYYATLVSHVEKSQIDIVEVTGVWLFPILFTVASMWRGNGVSQEHEGFPLLNKLF